MTCYIILFGNLIHLIILLIRKINFVRNINIIKKNRANNFFLKLASENLIYYESDYEGEIHKPVE